MLAEQEQAASIDVVALAPNASVEFVSSVFRLYRTHQPFVFTHAQDAQQLLPRGLTLCGVEEPAKTKGWFEEQHNPIMSSDAAQISFTSGTTSKPKGIILTYRNLAVTVERLVGFQRLDATVSEYVGVPPHHSFGLARVRACAAVGGRAYLPPRGFDPVELGRMLRDGEVNALSAVPTLLRILINEPGTIGRTGRRMRWIEIGSQHMTLREKEQLKALFPEAHIVQHYGLTEAARTTLLAVSDVEGARLDSSGRATDGTDLALTADGRIRVRGPHVAREWVGHDGVKPLVDAQGWLTTNDHGDIDQDGFLFYRGRADDLINFGGVKLHPDLIEERIRAQLVAPISIAVARIPDEARGDGILLATDAAGTAPAALRSVALDVLSSFGVAAGNGLEVAIVESIPVTETGKVRRKALAESYLAHERTTEAAVLPPRGSEEPGLGVVRDAFRTTFPRRQVKSTDSFVGLGGDSLAHISILIHLEGRGAALPDGWEERSLADLEALYRQAHRRRAHVLSLRPINLEVLIRALAVTMIVLHHASPFEIGGGIDVLLLLIGVNLAKFQTRRLASKGRWTLLTDLIWKLVLPYYLVVALLSFAQPDKMWTSDWFLMSNFAGGRVGHISPYWFVLGYVQTLLLLCALASIPMVGRAMRDHSSQFGLILLCAALVLKVAAMGAFQHTALLGRTPDQFLYLIALGWCVQTAQGRATRLALVGLTLAIAVLGAADIWPLWSGFGGRWHGIALFWAVLVLLASVKVRIPGLLRAPVTEIAVASLFIYMLHPAILDVTRHHMPWLLTAFVAISGALVAARLVTFALRHQPERWLRARPKVISVAPSR